MDYMKAVKEKRDQWGNLFKRMDNDRDLVYLVPYVMKDLRDQKVPGVINVTHNRPAVFMAKVVSALGLTSEQLIIESEDKNIDTAMIEEFQRLAFRSANAKLAKEGGKQLEPYFDYHACIRGRVAARCLFRMKDGILIPDIKGWDSRFVFYETGSNGLDWAALEVRKSRGQIESEEWAKEKKFKLEKKSAIVTDIWHTEGNEVYVDSKKVYEQEHRFGFTPVAVQTVTLGSMLADEGSLEHEGESIFFLIRGLVTELNRLLSILQTINMKLVKGSKQYASKEGPQATPPGYEDTETGTVIATDIGGGIQPVQIADIQRATIYCLSQINTALQEGSLSSVDLGTLAFQLSAVALIEIGEGRDQVYMPRLVAKGLLKKQLAEMLTRQVIQLGLPSIELGTPGHKRSFDVSKLDGEYEVDFKYSPKSPKIDVARYSVAGAAERYLDPESILRDIIQAEDPEGIMRKRYYYMAEKISPAVMRRRVVEALIEEDRDEEAKLLADEAGVELEKLLAGELPTPTAPEEKPPEPMLPLFGKGGGLSSAKKAAEIEATPRGEE